MDIELDGSEREESDEASGGRGDLSEEEIEYSQLKDHQIYPIYSERLR